MEIDKPYYFIHEAMEVLNCTEDDIYRYFHTDKLTASLFVENMEFLVVEKDTRIYRGKVKLTGVVNITDQAGCVNFYDLSKPEIRLNHTRFICNSQEIKFHRWNEEEPIWFSPTFPNLKWQGIASAEFSRTKSQDIYFIPSPKIMINIEGQQIDDLERFIDNGFQPISFQISTFDREGWQWLLNTIEYGLSYPIAQRRNLVVTEIAIDVFQSLWGKGLKSKITHQNERHTFSTEDFSNEDLSDQKLGKKIREQNADSAKRRGECSKKDTAEFWAPLIKMANDLLEERPELNKKALAEIIINRQEKKDPEELINPNTNSLITVRTFRSKL